MWDTWQNAPEWLIGVDPCRLALTLVVLLAIGLCFVAIELLSGWKRITAITLVLVIMALLIHSANAHDSAHPELNDWMAGLHSKNKTWCCLGDDDDPIDKWETKSNGYRVQFRGEWYDVPDSALVDEPNKAGVPKLWMNKGYLGKSVRCFMPGTLG